MGLPLGPLLANIFKISSEELFFLKYLKYFLNQEIEHLKTVFCNINDFTKNVVHESHKWAYYIFQFSFFQVKTVNPYEDETIFLDTQHLVKENIPYQYFHHNLLWSLL